MTRAEYVTALALTSAHVVAAVHRADDPGPFVAAALSLQPPDGIDPVVAWSTVLAAQIDPDTNLADRLEWTRAYDPAVVAACANGGGETHA